MEADMQDEISALADAVDFSGVVSLRSAVGVELSRSFADRAHNIPNTMDTRFGTASATKGLTALTIMSLVESGELDLEATVRSLTGELLPGVDATVTVEHLLTHTSGVGDYLDESVDGDIDDYVLGVSPHTLEWPSDYVPLLNAHGQTSMPGERFVYNNSGYIMLSIIIERLTGSYVEAVASRVLRPAGMEQSGFFRSDDLPCGCALGYCQDGRSNIFHLPVIGAGDGGVFLTAADVSKFWKALRTGRIVSERALQNMLRVWNSGHSNGAYGMGFWLTEDGEVAWLEGMDAGVSFKSAIHLASGHHYAVLANTSSGAWEISRLLDRLL